MVVLHRDYPAGEKGKVMPMTTLLPALLRLQQLVSHMQQCQWLPQYTVDGYLDLGKLSRDERLDAMMRHYLRELLQDLGGCYATIQHWAGVHLGTLKHAPEFLRQMGIYAEEKREENEYSPILVLSIPTGGCLDGVGSYTVRCGAVNQ